MAEDEMQRRGLRSRDASPGSSLAWEHSKNDQGNVLRSDLNRSAPVVDRRFGEEKLRVAARRDNNLGSVAFGLSERASGTRKTGGLKNAFRRLFSKRSAKKRISLPAPMESRVERPNTMVAAPTMTNLHSVPAPTNGVLRSSALGSHAPSAPLMPISMNGNGEVLAPPDRPPPPRPPRPRRVSLPSVFLSTQDGEAIHQALTGLGLQDLRDDSVETRNIGFAVTSGSNPHRRSRSVGGYRDSMKEHRMSPVQWRQWRRRSDEIRYWRASIDQLQDQVLLDVPQAKSKSTSCTGGTNERHLDPTDDNFDFDLELEEPRPDAHGVISHEYSQVEERMITLELTMMRLELALSKLQAGSFSPVARRSNHYEPGLISEANHSGTQSESTIPPIRAETNQGIETPAPQQSPFSAEATIGSQQRPHSVATTLKAAGNQQSSPAKTSLNRGSRRSSITELTIDHYTTLLSLIRRERSARMHLENQVLQLTEQVRAMQSQGGSVFLHRRNRSSSNLDKQYPLADSGRPHFPSDEPIGKYEADSQPRSINNSLEGGYDTDDASFHETYVTPIEREELEGKRHGLEEGIAF